MLFDALLVLVPLLWGIVDREREWAGSLRPVQSRTRSVRLCSVRSASTTRTGKPRRSKHARGRVQRPI